MDIWRLSRGSTRGPLGAILPFTEPTPWGPHAGASAVGGTSHRAVDSRAPRTPAGTWSGRFRGSNTALHHPSAHDSDSDQDSRSPLRPLRPYAPMSRYCLIGARGSCGWLDCGAPSRARRNGHRRSQTDEARRRDEAAARPNVGEGLDPSRGSPQGAPLKDAPSACEPPGRASGRKSFWKDGTTVREVAGRLNPYAQRPQSGRGLKLHVLDEELGGVQLVVGQRYRHLTREVELACPISIRGEHQEFRGSGSCPDTD